MMRHNNTVIIAKIAIVRLFESTLIGIREATHMIIDAISGVKYLPWIPSIYPYPTGLKKI